MLSLYVVLSILSHACVLFWSIICCWDYALDRVNYAGVNSECLLKSALLSTRGLFELPIPQEGQVDFPVIQYVDDTLLVMEAKWPIQNC